MTLVKWVLRLFGVAITILVISLAISFVHATGVARALDEAIGSGNIEETAQLADDLAHDVSSTVWRIGEAIPLIGPAFSSFADAAEEARALTQSLGNRAGDAAASATQTVQTTLEETQSALEQILGGFSF